MMRGHPIGCDDFPQRMILNAWILDRQFFEDGRDSFTAGRRNAHAALAEALQSLIA